MGSQVPADRLAEMISVWRDSPARFVRDVFAWGEGDLAGQPGPDDWQADILDTLGRGMVARRPRQQVAVASGHGIGKTALIAWIILWFIATRANPQIVVTANTSQQLEQKTWRELALWLRRSAVADLFAWTATKLSLKEQPATWFAAAVPWSEERPEAFAGTHAANVLVVYDEASLIPDAIWEVTEGAMTTAGALWVVFGNPTRNTGRFRECFGRFRHRWETRQVDSRTARMADRGWADQAVADYGLDSDYVKVRVLGQFPSAGANQLIPTDLVDGGWGKVLPVPSYQGSARVIGLDVAREGDDSSALIRRQGLMASGLKRWRLDDTMRLVGMVVQEIKDYQPDMVFVDSTGGYGAGVVDRLRQLGYHQVVGVNFATRADADDRYANKRAEMWDGIKGWLKAGGALPGDQQLRDDLIGPEYHFDGKNRLLLEKKEDMKRRGLASPDAGDALALTFAVQVQPRAAHGLWASESEKVEYDPFNFH